MSIGSSSSTESEDELRCVICMEKYAPSAFVKSKNCGHGACGLCMVKWMCATPAKVRLSTCPLCRSNLFERDICHLVYLNQRPIDGMSIEILDTIKFATACTEPKFRLRYVKRMLYHRAIFVSKIENPDDPSEGTSRWVRPTSKDIFTQETL
ncbi:hypothetical protein ACOME3_008104 [Neoechinorhynchus agilis]